MEKRQNSRKNLRFTSSRDYLSHSHQTKDDKALHILQLHMRCLFFGFDLFNTMFTRLSRKKTISKTTTNLGLY